MKQTLQTPASEYHLSARSILSWRLLGTSVLAALLAACGGGGGGGGSSSVVPTVTPSPSASSTATAAPTSAPALSSTCTSGVDIQSFRRTLALPTTVPTLATYTITSNPTGLPVSINQASSGVTPLTSQPQPADAAYTITIGSGSKQAFYCYSQVAGPSHTIFYNSVNDTSGSIASISTSSVARQVQSAVSAFDTTELARHALRTAPASNVASDSLYVKYRSDVLSANNRTILDTESRAGVGTGITLGPQDGATINRVVHPSAGVTLTQLQSTLAADPAVASVNPVHLRYPLSVTPVTPNDPQFASGDTKQWDMYEIQAPLGWGISTGSSSIPIAVIDTGYDANAPDLSSKVTYSESDINGVTTAGSTASQDTDGHGTNVAGIAAAATNNGIAVAGVGYNTSLQIYRIFTVTSSGVNANTSDEAQAIYNAVTHGAKVISLSLGGTEGYGNLGIDAAEYDAVEYAISHNVTVVAAAGNERSTSTSGSVVTSVDYPAAYPGVIAVGASALNDTANPNSRSSATEYVASYSNSGPELALVAPGGDPSSAADSDSLHWILNLDTSTPVSSSNTCSTPSACLALFAGTSQAAPHVSGAAALLLAVNGNLTPAQIKTILMSTADNINDVRQGAGRLNVYRALAAATGQTTTPPVAQNFIAFAYSNSGGTTPSIIDSTFTTGVPVSANGTFRLSDISASATSYRIAVWADLNGDGVIDQGDYIGVSGACSGTGPCTATGITVSPVPAGYTLP